MFGDVQWKLDFVKQLYCQPQYSLFRFEFGRLIALKFTASHKQWVETAQLTYHAPTTN
jgi:hypothetical protein